MILSPPPLPALKFWYLLSPHPDRIVNSWIGFSGKRALRWSVAAGCFLGSTLGSHSCGRGRTRRQDKTETEVQLRCRLTKPGTLRLKWHTTSQLSHAERSRDGQAFYALPAWSWDVGALGKGGTLGEVALSVKTQWGGHLPTGHVQLPQVLRGGF